VSVDSHIHAVSARDGTSTSAPTASA
jgi:hypothetical protein